MKRNKGAKPTRDALQVWTFAQAQAALPYLKSVVRALREHGIAALAGHRRLRQLAERFGRPTRTHLIAEQEAQRELQHAEADFQEAAAELETMDVFSLDPIRGQALIPFVQDEQLAWFIFDLFDDKPLRFWRLQTDPEETRRPITSNQQGRSGTAQIA